jgi:hypothetical protein
MSLSGFTLYRTTTCRADADHNWYTWIESWQQLINLYEAWNKPEKAKEWRAKLPKTETITE